jgi:hypothetical protein
MERAEDVGLSAVVRWSVEGLPLWDDPELALYPGREVGISS